MATFYRSTRLWAVEFQYDGRTRHWVTALPSQEEDAQLIFRQRLANLYGSHARLIDVRLATPDEESQFIAGTLPRNVYCPVLRAQPRKP